jgi:hypothetical protein
MMKKIAAVVVVLLLAGAGMAYAQGTGSISGTATNAQGSQLVGVKVQLRNVDTGQLVSTTVSGANGAFTFTGLSQGNYVIEIVDSNGKIIGQSTSMAVGAAGVISGVTVAASAAGALAGAAAAGGLGAFFTSTGGILLLAGVGAGVTAGVIAATTGGTTSPSR